MDLPVIGVGGIRESEYADKLIRQGIVDLVAVGRPLLQDSSWATNAIQKLKTRTEEKSFESSKNQT